MRPTNLKNPPHQFSKSPTNSSTKSFIVTNPIARPFRSTTTPTVCRARCISVIADRTDCSPISVITGFKCAPSRNPLAVPAPPTPIPDACIDNASSTSTIPSTSVVLRPNTGNRDTLYRRTNARNPSNEIDAGTPTTRFHGIITSRTLIRAKRNARCTKSCCVPLNTPVAADS